MHDLVIRPAELKDAQGIAKVHTTTWQTAYREMIPNSFLDSLSIEKRTIRWREILAKPEENSQTFVALVDGKIVGFCSVSYCRDSDMSKETGELWSIYVDKNFEGKGIGSSLLNRGIDYLISEGFKKATLWVLTANTKTREWYEEKGWVVEGKTKIDTDDGFEMHETRYTIYL